jgi:S1-C subfamily serine protease
LSLSTQIKSGVVVEAVQKESLAEKAGLRVDDILLSWKRNDAHGEIESPFDITFLQTEHATRGAVILEGFRGKEHRILDISAWLWGVIARRNLPEISPRSEAKVATC